VRKAVVRGALPGDAPELAGLRWEFRSTLAAPAEDRELFLARATAWIRDRLETRDAPEPGSRWLCWVAGHEGAIVGNIWMQLQEKIPNPVAEPEWHGYVSSFFVLAAHRGGGVGSALLGAAIAEAKRLALDRLVLWPTPKSRPLYERHGFGAPRALLELPLR
jgi:GNAT superfamily N-acetyltransferase